MIELYDILNGIHQAELRQNAVFIDDAEVFDLQPAPGGNGIYIILRGRGWPLHFSADQLQALTPIAGYLPRTYACWGCQGPVLYLEGPPPDEKWCPKCHATQAQAGAAWEAHRAQERQQYAGMDRAQIEALYQQAKARVQQLTYGSDEWHHWRRIQIDTSRGLADH